MRRLFFCGQPMYKQAMPDTLAPADALQASAFLNDTAMRLGIQVLSGTPLTRDQARELTKLEGNDIYDFNAV